MKVTTEFFQDIRELVPVSHVVRSKVSLTKKAGEYSGRCPFHQEKTPSFTVNDAKRFYHCFGCGAHGDVIKFVSEIHGLKYKDAAIKIAKENSISIPKLSAAEEGKQKEIDEIYDVLELVNGFFMASMTQEVKDYLLKRGMNADYIKRFCLGYAPAGGQVLQFCKSHGVSSELLIKAGILGKKDNGRVYDIFHHRVTFPIKNIYNKILGFGARVLDASLPKYINSPETIIFKKSDTLFGENFATGRMYRDNYAILVEGYMDVIALHQAGFDHAVASLGTAVTSSHIRKLWRSCDEIIVCLDGDEAGKRAKSRLIDMVISEVKAEKFISFLDLPDAMDPDSLIKAEGVGAFESLLSQRRHLSETIWKIETTGKDFSTPEHRAILEHKLAGYYAQVTDINLQNNLKHYFRQMVWERIIKNTRGSNHNNSATRPVAILDAIGKNLKNSTDYTELDFLEHSLCALVVCLAQKQPEFACEYSANISFSNTQLQEFKESILDWCQQDPGITSTELEELIKNSGFYEIYLLLSAADNLFIDSVLAEELIKHRSSLVIDWLHKKHYLLTLIKEYEEIVKNSNSQISSKITSYIAEIQKVLEELNELDQALYLD